MRPLDRNTNVISHHEKKRIRNLAVEVVVELEGEVEGLQLAVMGEVEAEELVDVQYSSQ